MTYVLAILGLLVIAAILVLGFILSYWVCMAGISAIYMEYKTFGIAIIASSVGSMLTAIAMAAGLFWLLTTYLPL
ncbi:MAG: hypothetical protein IJZ68_08600 [Bacteroidaceae bacterium]|nr:hypothetical protein [Bacteroidaceae bacterium]